VLCGVTQAETLDVCPTGCTYTTIQAAIDASSDGDEILVGPGTYTSTQDGHVVDMKGKAITLRASDGPEVTIIDGENARRGIACFNGETDASVIHGFTIRNGSSTGYDYDGEESEYNWDVKAGGVLCYLSNPTISSCIIKDNTGPGGQSHGIFCYFSSPTITDCTISNNSAGIGAGIWFENSDGDIIGCTITGNVGGFGGGIAINESNATITGCTISGNTAMTGGGICCAFNSSATITDCTISANTAGGGILGLSSSSITVTNCTISGNTALTRGGGIGLSNGTITNCVISNNSCGGRGGGVDLDNGSADITDCLILNNSVATMGDGQYSWDGGGIYSYGNDCVMTNCVISGNSAASDGGGIFNALSSSSVTMTNCLISNNTANEKGGGIIVRCLSAFIGCEITGNTAGCDNWGSCGGGIYNPVSCTLADSIVCGNVPDQIVLPWGDDGGNTIAEECQDDCPGDFDGDGTVGVHELLTIIGFWGSTGPVGDINLDGTVNVEDLLIVIGAWGSCP
jgi:hypothetical protein